jgi:hypothetical protein
MSKSLYTIAVCMDETVDEDWVVIRKSDGLSVYYGTRAECVEWVERNGADEWR